MKNFSIALKLKLLLLFGGALLILLFSSAYIYYGTRTIQQNLEAETQNVADLLGSRLSTSIVFGLQESIETKLHEAALDDSYEAICVFNSVGVLISSKVNGSSPACKNLNRENQGFSVNVENEPTYQGITTISNIWSSNELIGAILINRNENAVTSYIQDQLQILGVVTALSLIIYFFIASGLQRIISRPIIEISQNAKNIVAANSNIDVNNPHHYDEVNVIREALAILSVRINAQLDKLAKQNGESHLACGNIVGGLRRLIQEHEENVNAISALTDLKKHKVLGNNIDEYEHYHMDVYDSILNYDVKLRSFKRISDIYYHSILQKQQVLDLAAFLRDFNAQMKGSLSFVSITDNLSPNESCDILVYKSAWNEGFTTLSRLYDTLSAIVPFNAQLDILLDKEAETLTFAFYDRIRYSAGASKEFQAFLKMASEKASRPNEEMAAYDLKKYTEPNVDPFLDENLLDRDQLKYIIDMITYISSANNMMAHVEFNDHFFALCFNIKLSEIEAGSESAKERIPEMS